MNVEEFRKYGHVFVDWMADYMRDIEKFPVKSQVKPGDIGAKIPDAVPEVGETMEQIFADFNEIILPGITHWQSPNFFAYFPASSSKPSVLAEMLTATMGAQCMLWSTSPAAAELEEEMMRWLKEMLNLPADWEGVIQDTASTATLCALITARELKSEFNINEDGFKDQRFTVYASKQAHSSISKDVKIAGLGENNLRLIEVDDEFAMKVDDLEKQIKDDIQNGFTPLCIVAALGTTGTTAIDPVDQIGVIAKKYNAWFHIDAAYAGTALIIPEFRERFKHLELADSFVFNPHKWMFTNFDCTAYFVKDKDALIRTFAATPEYLKTKEEDVVNNYKDWGIQLGRRFRALKLWFVIRYYGKNGIKEKIEEHVAYSQWFANEVKKHPNFELMAPVPLNTVCFRYTAKGKDDEELNQLNDTLMNGLNDSGKLYMTHTKLKGKYTIRFVPGQFEVTKLHIERAWHLIESEAEKLTNG